MAYRFSWTQQDCTPGKDILHTHPSDCASSPRRAPQAPRTAAAGLVSALLTLACAATIVPSAAAQGNAAKPASASPIAPRTTSLPAKGLFKGDQLSDATRARLTEVIIDALGLDVEVALLVPTGPWQIDGAGHTDRDLNEARLKALRTFLTDRGIEPKRIFVESRVDAKLTEPRLDVQLIGRPASN